MSKKEEQTPTNDLETRFHGAAVGRWEKQLGELEDFGRLAAQEIGATRSVKQTSRQMQKINAEANRIILFLQTKSSHYTDRMGGIKVACSKGCCHCCYQQVGASVPEVIEIAQFVRDTFDDSQISELRDRLRVYREAYLAESDEEREKHRRICPMLVSDMCSVHEARPLVCRGFNSTNAEICRIKRFEPEKKTRFVQYVNQALAPRHLRLGLSQELTQQGFVVKTVDVAMTLDILLEDPASADRWLAGENPFEIAEIASANLTEGDTISEAS